MRHEAQASGIFACLVDLNTGQLENMFLYRAETSRMLCGIGRDFEYHL
jgi:hypothetical protein